jgi:two-component system, cell cycle response regulator
MAELIPPVTDTPPPLPHLLLVDDSRIVRAMIGKHVRNRFQLREEADGEAGWATLLLDPTIQVVISDLSMPKLDGFGLLERIRSSHLSRIRDMPVIVISGDEDESARDQARELGANDFITKGIGTAELLARLETLVKLTRTSEALEQSRAEAAVDPSTGLMVRSLLLKQGEQALSYARRHGGVVSASVICFDPSPDLAGPDEAAAFEALTAYFAKLLAGKMRKEDSLARWSERAVATLSPGIDDAQAVAFADRVRESIARAGIQLRGKAVKVSISVGIASNLTDGHEPEVLFGTAEKRMHEGMAAGGNRVISGEKAQVIESVDGALALVASGHGDDLSRSRLVQIGLRLMPLLRLLNQKLGLDLPVDDIARRLSASK